MLGGYDSSDDEVNVAKHAADAFGIKRIEEPSSKRTRVDAEQVLQAQAAPDVLAEVCTIYHTLNNANKCTGSPCTNLPRAPTDRRADERQCAIRRHGAPRPRP
jgi:hypothetical protein